MVVILDYEVEVKYCDGKVERSLGFLWFYRVVISLVVCVFECYLYKREIIFFFDILVGLRYV